MAGSAWRTMAAPTRSRPRAWRCCGMNRALAAASRKDEMSTQKERSAAASVLGKKGGPVGGRSKSPAKQAASARNGQLGGRPSRYRLGWRDAMRRAVQMVRAQAHFEEPGSLARETMSKLADFIEAEPAPGKE